MISFFLIQVFTVTKKPALLYEKIQIFEQPLTVSLLLMLPFSEAAIHWCSIKKVFVKLLQIFRKKNSCVGVSFQIKLQASSLEIY